MHYFDILCLGLLFGLVVKNLPANVGGTVDLHSIPGSGRSPGGGHGDVLQNSCLEDPHRQRNLGGYGPWGRKKSDTTEATYYIVHTHAFLSLKYLLHRIIERKKINNRGKSQQIYSKCFLLFTSFLALDK